jgi:hypothetical protein
MHETTLWAKTKPCELWAQPSGQLHTGWPTLGRDKTVWGCSARAPWEEVRGPLERMADEPPHDSRRRLHNVNTKNIILY